MKTKKFQDKYLSGSSDESERKKLMTEISNIYEKYRGGDKKKPFPKKVQERLKTLMKKRDKL